MISLFQRPCTQRDSLSRVRRIPRPGARVALGVLCCVPLTAGAAPEERSVAELRNTVINLVQALVERGIMTRDQAQAMIRDAQAKAEAEVASAEAARKAQEEAEASAVRVPYVPQIVRDEIRKEVVAELTPSVTREVEQDIRSKDSLREALPEWVQKMNWTGDVRTRGEDDVFARDNIANTYLDFNQINGKGGIDKAGTLAVLNTTHDRDRLRVRLRFGFDTTLGAGWSAGMRLATGSGEIFPTTNQTEGTYGTKYQIAVDQGYVRWTGEAANGRQTFTTTLGRFADPWLSTDLVWYNDLTFEGLTGDYRVNLSSFSATPKTVFLRLGAFPLQTFAVFDSNPVGRNKWLAGAQLGADLHSDGDARLRFGAAYYDYIHTGGRRNTLESTAYNYTAPPLVQKGNTLFDISNTADPTINLYALAADYRIIDVTAIADWHVLTRYALSLTAQGVRNVGYRTAQVMARTGIYVAPRTRGYRTDLGFGSAVQGEPRSWRAAFGYRYLERDAVLDALNDHDFHLGGTDTKGYTVTLDYSFNPHVWLRVNYLSANEIDGPPLGVDVWQLDVNTRF